MNIKLKRITFRGDLEKERIVLEAIRDLDIGGYAIFVSRDLGEGKVSSNIKLTYWFPDKSIKSGDLVVLYSKSRLNSEKLNQDGTTTHFYYWEQAKAVFDTEESCAIVVEIKEWVPSTGG
jgi:hypothetical protein